MVGKGHLENLLSRIRWTLILSIFLSGGALIGGSYLMQAVFGLSLAQSSLGLVGLLLVISLLAGTILASRLSQPLEFLAQAILHISPAHNLVEAPDTQKLRLGRELVTNLVRQVYDFAGSGPSVENKHDESEVLNQLPLAVIGLDPSQKVVFANPAARKYFSIPANGESLSTLNLTYEGEVTLDSWLAGVRDQKVTDERSWERIRFNPPEGKPRYFDMAASYSKHSASGAETLLAIFDHSQRYGADDNSISFVALAVHELRTPLTVLRGYIEVFEDEFAGKLSPEMTGFMQKMEASAESLTTFVSNILNVAKVDQDELTLKLAETNWPSLLKEVIDAMQLRASVYGKTIELAAEPNLPTVAADKVSIAEVINNLLDNAIKYSPDGVDRIVVRAAMGQDGTVETTVQDFGIGIPESVMPHIFEKFYRNHRSKTSVAGSGLGLYLSKAIVAAHEGNIWARSEDGKGSTFGFNLLPYSQLAEERKNPDNANITRSAHGWIKNHSLQRR